MEENKETLINRERETLTGKYDSISMTAKFSKLSPDLVDILDKELNQQGLSFKENICSGSFFEEVDETFAEQVSSLLGDLYMNVENENEKRKIAKELAKTLANS